MKKEFKSSIISNEREIENFVAELISGKYSNRIHLSADSNFLNIADKLNSLAATLESNAIEQDNAQRIAKIGNWSFDLTNGKIFWSKELFNLHPVDPNMEPPDFNALCQMVHPDDRAGFQALVEQCALNGTSYHSTHRIVFPDRVLWMDAFGYARMDSEGKVVSLYGTAQDITEQVDREELSRITLEAVQIGYWKLNPNDQSLFWDRSMYKIYGVKAEDFSGHIEAWESTLTPDAKIKAVEELNLALSGEKEFDTIFEINTQSTGRRYISARGKVVRDSSGKPLMMYGVNVDITEQRKNELEKERVAKFLEVVLQNIPTMIFAKDCQDQFRFSLINKAGEKIFGMPASQFIGKNDYEVFPKDKADELRKADLEIIKGKSLTVSETVWDSPSGSKTLQTIKLPVYDEYNNPTYIIGISNDITEDLKIKASLEEERVKTFRNSKLASLGEMSAGIAHEVNNPLTIISSTANLLEKFKDDPEKFKAKIELIKKSTNRINRIVQGLKKFSRSNTLSHRQHFIIQNIIADSLVLTEAKAKDHSISVFIESDLPLTIHCDEIEIEQVLVNLINNSIDAIKNLNEKWIRISVKEDNLFVILQIEDSGPGIPKEVTEKIFDPFFTTKEVGAGTGLGLSITKGILDEHGASISVLENTSFTCFEVRFKKDQAPSRVA